MITESKSLVDEMSLADQYELAHFEAEMEFAEKRKRWEDWQRRHPILNAILESAFICGLTMASRK
jgi:hypothetical protein